MQMSNHRIQIKKWGIGWIFDIYSELVNRAY